MLAGIALVLIASACAGDDDVAVTTTVIASPTTTATTSPSTTTAITIAATTTTSPTTTQATTTLPPSRPLPFDSWTTVLASLPVGDYSAGDASAVAAELGIAGVGVLLSDDYPSLNPGFWVVYTRPYEFSWEAVEACGEIGDAVPDCYARYLGVNPNEPIGRSEGTLIAHTEDARLVVLSATTGEVIRTIRPSFGDDGSFPGRPALAADGLSIDFGVGSEDYWFSCEASDGHLERIDLATGRSAKVGDGFAPRVSPDGTTLGYLASSDCFPDPAEPQFVLAPIDTIVRRDIATGGESRQTIPLTGDVAQGYELWDLAWGADDLFVLDSVGGIWRYRSGDPDLVPIVDLGAAGLDAGGHSLVGYDAGRDRLLVTYAFFDTDAQFTELHEVDPDTGAIAFLDIYEGSVAVTLDRTGAHLAIIANGVLEADGAEVEAPLGVVGLAW